MQFKSRIKSYYTENATDKLETDNLICKLGENASIWTSIKLFLVLWGGKKMGRALLQWADIHEITACSRDILKQLETNLLKKNEKNKNLTIIWKTYGWWSVMVIKLVHQENTSNKQL